ncbi:bacterial Ig-like domain-containing protein [Paenibacillus thermoaerophilus]|uniref:Bacterial Ig-like domain-containing protein n=1 Tax=Paenibacillus thermoaerophilus TaxID=1215385 RepID=A0ABW2V5Q6_9BACL|nr:bacterial Ig-like domain-containing protein [Paenibacillus thermoaerophilus]TMV13899.1 exopolygalacturonate lyase [Paenibacillus thermoaerophilus]
MKKSKRLMALLMSLVLSVPALTPAAAAAEPGSERPMIDIPAASKWQGSVFGSVGGQDKIHPDNFEIKEEADGTAVLRSSNDRGKISSTTDGIAYYYRSVPVDANFELTATATVEHWTANNQVSFGLMLRNEAYVNVSGDVYGAGDTLVLGALDQKMMSFDRQGGVLAKHAAFGGSPEPAAGQTYDLSIKKSGNVYQLRIGGETRTIENYASPVAYAGLYTARNTKVVFSNVSLKIEGEVETGDWQFRAFGSNTSGTANPAPTLNEQGVTMSAGGGKIASGDEGISFYYKELPADANFEIRAKAAVISFNGNSDINNANQKSFGLMLRGAVGEHGSTSTFTSEYVAVGALDTVMKAFYKKLVNPDPKTYTQSKLNPFAGVNNPAPDQTYDLSLKKSGLTFVMTVNGQSETVTFDSWETDTIYAGLYVARDAAVTFSDYEIQVNAKVVSSLIVDTSAMKTQYLKGAPLDLTGLRVTAVYTDGTSAPLNAGDYIVTGFNSSTPGPNTLTISYNGVTAFVELEILALTVTNMTILYPPAKTVYYPGDRFDPQGLVVLAEYDNGFLKDQPLTEDLYSISIPGATVVEATYVFNEPGGYAVYVQSAETPGISASFEVSVMDTELTGIEIRRGPQKTLYDLGDAFDPDGMVVYARYADGSEVRLLRNEYAVSALDSSSPGEKTVVVAHKGKTAEIAVTVKQKELTGIEVAAYPKTTYTVGEAFDRTGLAVKKVYDNGDREALAEAEYSLDTSAYRADAAGVYGIRIIPDDPSLEPITLNVTVREAAAVEWKTIVFGQSTGSGKNMINIKNEGTPSPVVEIIANDGGGKITGDHDGISFYYTELDAAADNFVLSADIKVLQYAKTPHDGQESFGIMARDAIGKPGDSSVFASNIAAVGGYSGGTRDPNGTQFFIRTGVTSPDGAGSQGIRKIMLRNELPTEDNTHPKKPYRLTLAKTNSGYTARLNDEAEKIFYEPDILNVQDGKIYVGFYAARQAKIEVSNIRLTVTAAATDAPKVEAPPVPQTADFAIQSLDKTSSADYTLRVKPTVDGWITVKQGSKVIAADLAAEAGKQTAISATLEEQADNRFSIVFLPDDTQLLTSYDKIVKNFTVTHKSYVPGGDIYVSPSGTAAGTGTKENPLDLDTAIAFVRPGQKIVVAEGTYKRSSKLDIPKDNSGTAENRKYLVAEPGARPVIDFDKKSEGVVLSGSYWHVKGIDFARSAGNTRGFTIGGHHNIVENSRFYEHGDTGLQISRTDDSNDISEWPSYNLILNCTSFDNRDPSENNADGFAAKLTVGPGNVFRGAIAHNNIDDGWDLYTKAGSGPIGAVTIEDSIAFGNGRLTNGYEGKGDKNGFKLGGEGIYVPHVIKNSIAFGNGAAGFTSNSNPGVIAQNNIGFDNAKGNLVFTTYANIQEQFRIEGFVSYQKSYTAKDQYPSRLDSDANFMFNGTESVNKSGVKLTDANFKSLVPVSEYMRDEDGNIIWGDFLKFIPPAQPGSGSWSGTANPGYTLTDTDGGVRLSVEPARETADGRTTAKAVLDGLGQAVEALLARTSAAETIEVEVKGEDEAVRVVFPAGSLTEAIAKIPDLLLSIRHGGVTYDLPVSALNQAALEKRLGTDKAELELSIAPVSGAGLAEIEAAAEAEGLALESAPIEFRLTASAGGQSVEVNDFGSTYVSRTLTLNQPVDAARATVALYDPASGEFSFVPSVFGERDGAARVTLKRPGNSIYAVIGYERSFADLSGHWSQSDVELLASKLVVDGMTATAYAPDERVTRAQFAALLVRALGLTESAEAAGFSDVADSAWYAGAVGAAARFGLIEGFEDGTFRPDASITREQMAAMIARAMAAAGKPGAAGTAGADRFADSADISPWAREAVAQAAEAGIVDGVGSGAFAPGDYATRAQAAVMLKRLLAHAEFINS